MMKEAVQNASAPAMKIVAHIYNDFPAKFGIPRQSGLVNTLPSKLVMEPDYRNVDAFRGIEGFSHLWLLWMFSESIRDNWTPTVHPPRLGGNQRMGVFATRSPFRPNPIGLSSVRLDRVDLHTKEGPVLFVSGADLMSGTPIYDIKPYLPYADSHPDAKGGFTDHIRDYRLQVEFPEELIKEIPMGQREALLEVLANDPRPRYQNRPDKVYGLAYGHKDIHFQVRDDILTVCDVTEFSSQKSFDKQNNV